MALKHHCITVYGRRGPGPTITAELGYDRKWHILPPPRGTSEKILEEVRVAFQEFFRQFLEDNPDYGRGE